MTEGGIATPAQRAAAKPHRRQAPIVPPQNVAGRAMVFVIAIMTFLSCLTLGAVTLVRDTASTWQSQIAREATIQIKPADGLDMEAALADAARVAAQFSGVTSTSIVDREATARLLEPWLGTGLDIDELPVPRLVRNVAQGTFTPWSTRGRYVSLFEFMPGRALGLFEVPLYFPNPLVIKVLPKAALRTRSAPRSRPRAAPG